MHINYSLIPCEDLIPSNLNTAAGDPVPGASENAVSAGKT